MASVMGCTRSPSCCIHYRGLNEKMCQPSTIGVYPDITHMRRYTTLSLSCSGCSKVNLCAERESLSVCLFFGGYSATTDYDAVYERYQRQNLGDFPETTVLERHENKRKSQYVLANFNLEVSVVT
jgi:hypothetical protein